MIHSSTASSTVMLVGLAITYLLLPNGASVDIYRTAALGAALAISLGLFLEVRSVRSLIRVDLIVIVALFGLTLFEFFFPQEMVDRVVSPQMARHGVEALFLGFCGLIIGRHFAPRLPAVGLNHTVQQWKPATLFRVYIVVLVVGYSYMLWSVGFDPSEMVRQMLGSRFSQPWARGRYGGIEQLWAEFGKLFRYLIPAIAGAVLAKPFQFRQSQKAIVLLGLLLALFTAFASGTRTVFCIYLVIFLVSYILLAPNITWKRVIALSCLTAVLVLGAAYYMLQFRQVGLQSYVDRGASGWRKETLFIDYNLPAISRLTDAFPERFDYLGWEHVSFSILRPIPRILWPSKPEKLSVSAEEALGARGLTMSSTFVGEAYMTGGYFAVLIAGLLFGWLAGWWNRFGLNLGANANVILYASGFFAALLCMRSTVFFTTAMLPALAIWLYAKYRPRSSRPNAAVPIRRRTHT